MNHPRWACPMCEAETAGTPTRCPTCRAVVSFGDLKALLNNTEADRAALERAIARYQEQVAERSFAVHYHLALAHFNLQRHHAGLEQLREASALQPENGIVRKLLAILSERTSAPSPSGKGAILVVDDSATQRHFVAQVLNGHGFRVVTASSGEEALQKLDNLDLIFLDINMPGVDGYQVCKSIKENPATASIPVIMLSGKDGFFDKMRGRMVGATDHVTKPCPPEVLLATIEKYALTPASAGTSDSLVAEVPQR